MTNRMTRAAAALIVAAALLAIDAHSARAARGSRTVAVLYFDNNTGDRKLDVLQKGFADMIVTDLSAVRGLTVVERERLQKLLEELKLQRSRYFNKRTALRLGKGLGAQYVVTGAFAAMRPTMRIDLRMIEVATSKVALATKVTGKQDDLFKLEQQLIKRFVAKLALSFRPPSRPRTKVPDMLALLSYSKGIDLADKGKLKAAELRLATTARLAPMFALARIRKDELKRRLARSAQRRKFVLGKRGRELYRNVRSFVGSHSAAKASEADVRTLLAYRVVEGWFALRALRAHLSTARGMQLIAPGHQKAARRLMTKYVANRLQLMRELASYAKRFTKVMANGYRYLMTSYRLPPQDAQRARETKFGANPSLGLSAARIELAEFLLLGLGRDGSGKPLMIGPVPSVLVPKYERLGFRLLDEAVRYEEALLKHKTVGQNDWLAVRAAERAADALLLRGKRRAAAAKLQGILDRHPTSSHYKRIERRIKGLLGMTYDRQAKQHELYKKGLKSCDDMTLRRSMDTVMHQRMRLFGVRAIERTIKQIEKACRSNPRARRFWPYLYSHSALKVGRHGYCKLFDKLMGRYVQLGGSARDAAAYKRNYTSCP